MTKITEGMRVLIRASWFEHDPEDDSGVGVELIGSVPWQIARKLEAAGLGWIEGGAPNGSALPGLFFAKREAADLIGMWETDE